MIEKLLTQVPSAFFGSLQFKVIFQSGSPIRIEEIEQLQSISLKNQ